MTYLENLGGDGSRTNTIRQVETLEDIQSIRFDGSFLQQILHELGIII
jgi:hypothetical protein